MGTILGKQRYNEEPVELMRETKYFSQWTLADVRDLYARFRKTWGFAITESQLESLILLKQPDAVSIKEIFAILDATRDGKQDGRIDGLEFIGGLTVICQDTFEEKARFAFEVFDFNLNGSLSPIELALLMRSCYGGITILTGGCLASVPPIPTFVQVAQQAFGRFDRDHSDALNYEEFIAWARSNREFMLYMDAFRLISETAKERVPEAEWIQEASDDDSDIEVECCAPPPSPAPPTKPTTSASPFQLEPWMVEPLNPKPAPRRLPPVNISLEWVYGYRGYDARNNVRYTCHGDIVYSVSRHAIVYNAVRHEQRYYEGHTNAILSLAVCANGDKVATGDVGPNCAIHVWSPLSLDCLSILSQFHDDGIALLAFAQRYDTQLVSVGLDPNHRIAVWDWPSKSVVASGIGSTRKALAVAIHDNGQEVVVAGDKSLEFFSVDNRILKKERAALSTMGIWQGFLSVVYYQSYVIVGTSLGQLYQFQNRRLVRTTQAHPIKESVNCLYVARASLFSGGKDGTIHQWDSTLQTIGHPMDLSTLPLALSDFRITSLCYNYNDETNQGTLLVGTRSCKILQVNEVSGAVTLVTAFHQHEAVSGLATTPKRAEFASCGLDRVVRRWSLRKHEPLTSMPLLMYAPGQCLAYATSGDWLAMGCSDGTIVLLDHKCTKMLCNFRHARAAIVAIQWANNDQLLAASGANGLIYVYRVEPTTAATFRLCQQCLLKPLANEAAVPGTSLDFSVDNRYLQSQHGSSLRFWDLLSATRVSVVQHVRDTLWSSFRSRIGYSVQMLHANHDEISAACVNRHQTLLAAVTRNGSIALRAYPALDNLAKGVLGHSPHDLAFLGFARNDGLLVSATTADHCICQWKITKEAADEQPRPKHVVSAAEDPCADAHLLQWTPPSERSRPNPAMATLLTPSYYTPNPHHKAEAPDLDLELAYVHGMNWSNGRAMLGCTDTGAIVYSAATLGVVFEPSTRVQSRYVYHKQRITSVAVHPLGKVVATGSFSQLVIWDASSMETLGVHAVSAPVLFLAFNGADLLLAVIADRYHSVAAFLWKEMHQIDVAQNTLERVMDGAFTLDGASFVTCGVNHIRFWTVENRYHLTSQQGVFGRVALRQTLLCVATAGGNLTVTGCEDGSLILWEHTHAVCVVQAHSAPVKVALFHIALKTLVTAASDGSLLVWQVPSKASESLIQAARWSTAASASIVGVTAHDVTLVIVTDESLLIALSPSCLEWLITPMIALPSDARRSAEPNVLLAWHGLAVGAIRGLACHPTQAMIVTAGDDKTLRLWDLHTHLQLRAMVLASAPTALAYSPMPMADDKIHLAVAFASGALAVLDAATLVSLTTVALSHHACRDVEYAPCATVLAVACHDAKIYLVAIKDKLSYTLSKVCESTMPGRSPIAHVDFNLDSTILRSNTLDLECAFWDVATGALLEHSVAARETHWHSCTCPSNWALIGASQGIPLSCSDRVQSEKPGGAFSSQLPVVAVGDMQGRLQLLWYPCVERSAAKTYYGHASPLHTIRFSARNAFLLSLGSFDRTLFVWRTDFADEIKERASLTAPDASATKAHAALVSDERLLSHAFDTAKKDGGDEFLAVKPWLGAIREPSGWTVKPDDGDAPSGNLDLVFVHGYRGFDTRNNLRFGADSSSCIYHTAALGVVYNKQTHRQIFHYGHTNDILCLAVHPEGHLVVSGEVGKSPKLILWDANSGSSLCTMAGFHRRGVALVAFNATGDLIVSHGMDDDHSLALYSLQGKLVASCSASKQKILCLDVLASDGVSVGEKTVLFWSLSQTTISLKKGSFGKGDSRGTVLACIFVLNDAVTGQADGSLYRWKGRGVSTVLAHAHEGAINCLLHDVKAKNVVSGGRDGVVRLWSYSLEPLLSFDLRKASLASSSMKPREKDRSWTLNGSVRSLSVADGKLLLGTQGCEICEVDLADIRAKKDAVVTKFIEGHAGGELWGLAPHPEKQQFVTAGDDGTVRLWDGPNRTLLAKQSMPKKWRAVAMSPDGTHIAVGANDGSVVVLKEALDGDVVADLRVSLKAISVLRYAPDGKTLAVGSHDQRIYLFAAPAYTKRCVCKGHSSYITALDFSSDANYLQSNCGAYDLLFWQADKGKQVTSANALRDVKWATWTCTLGWPVQGIWPKGADGTDVNATARASSQRDLLTVDDNGHVNLFRYPCVAAHATAKTYLGHSSHVTNCAFTKGDMFAISTGGLDNAIFQFKYADK